MINEFKKHIIYIFEIYISNELLKYELKMY